MDSQSTAKEKIDRASRSASILHNLEPSVSTAIASIMFIINMSFMSVLEQVSRQISLPYASTIHEVLDDGTDIFGVEIDLPPLRPEERPRTLFFWSARCINSLTPYEQAAYMALCCLQNIYGFTISDYNYSNMIRYASLAQTLLPLANEGIQLARSITMYPHSEQNLPSHLRISAQQLLHHIDMIATSLTADANNSLA